MSLKRLYSRSILGLGAVAIFAYTVFSNYDSKPPEPRKTHPINISASHSIDSVVFTKNKKVSDSLSINLSEIKLSNEKDREKVNANNNYIDDHSLDVLVYGNDGYSLLTEKINTMLSSVKHNHRKIALSTPEVDSLGDISVSQKLRVYHMLKALRDTSFCNTIGEIISKDVADKYAEHGGIVNFSKNNKLQLKNVPSVLTRNEENAEKYSLNMEDITSPYVAIYHLHATTYNESEFAGPSSLDILSPGGMLDAVGEAHEFVITSLSKGKFNIDYYGGDTSIDKNLKIIDLGTYTYSLPSNSSSK
jgi:hypothetical protein